MLDFKKKGAIRVQMYETKQGFFVVRKYENRRWVESLVTDNKAKAENWFYWLVLLYTNQIKYIQES